MAVLRLPPTVHGEGDHGFVPTLINVARHQGRSGFLEHGANRWPAVHRLDAARAFRLAVENPFEVGCRFHAVAEEGIAFRDIATAIGRGLAVPVRSLPGAEGAEHFGGFARFAALDVPTSSLQTREQLGWSPTRLGLIADLNQGHYFSARA